MNIKDLPVLEETLQRYPWFALGHLELFRKTCDLGEDQKLACLSRTAAHVWSREKLYNLSKEIERRKETGDVFDYEDEILNVTDSADEILFEIEKEPLISQMPGKIILAGGDYFSREEMNQIDLDSEQPLDRFISEKPSLLKSGKSSPAVTEEQHATDISSVFDDPDFYTETLAGIYSQQGFYKRAIEIYAKLILLYPEKSSYFATLVQELRSKHNI